MPVSTTHPAFKETRHVSSYVQLASVATGILVQKPLSYYDVRRVLEIDGDESSTTTADVSELQLLIEGAAAVEVDMNISDGHSVERRRCCGGRGVPRRPASGRAGPQALADLSRGMAVAARGMLEAFQAARVGTA